MEITQIKKQLSIRKVLHHYNLTPDKNNMLRCPFHDDKTPSMKIYPETNTWTCFSSKCTAGTGDQIEMIQRKDNLTKHQAILKAASMLNGSAGLPVKSQAPAASTEPLKMFTSFKHALIRSPKAKDYAEKRHLNINRFEIGYNSGTTYKQMKHCIIFPLKNQSGEITSFYGRSILDKKDAKHYYTAGRTGLYPKCPAEKTESLILTESIIDAATLLQYPEITNNYTILSLYGTNGLTDEHTKAIKELRNLKEIILFFDGDEAGEKAAVKTGHALSQLSNVKISTVQTPENEDINSLSDGHEPDIYTHLLNNRKEFFLSTEKTLFETKEPKKPEELKEPEETKTLININNPDYITLTTNDLQITVLGGINLQQLDRLRITIKITHLSNSVRNNIDLYNIDQTDRFINKAAEKLETGTSTLNKAISELTDKLETYRLNKLEAQKISKPKDRILSEARKNKAIKYLSSPELLKRTNKDIGKTGMIGEENNRLLMYLVFTSRLRKQPLHIISLGGSGTGKTYLQEKISELIPEQEKKEITILSENAFYYFEKTELKHKLVLIEDMDGAEQVLYPLRELQSKRKISKTVPIKDSKGNLKTITLNVEGPICLSGTTTRERLYEDNANRSILIYLDNSKEHKEEIMNYQRKLSAGKINTKKEIEIKELFKDIQTVLKPVKVVNPYAEALKIPEHVFKPLRTNSHYLTFIETVTFYHQYQRTLKTDSTTGEKYIETEIQDIEEANRLIKDVLLTKSDELTKTVREFFESLKKWINRNKKQSFYSKELQERLRIYPMKVNRYLRELESRNFIRRIGGNRKKGYEYEIYRTEEYTKLQSGMNILDDILEKIKNGTPKPGQNKEDKEI
ncbi:MAG: DNA primase [Candidatus Methanophagaceae archaeon]|nr:MAG: DNA primase [Methanophagales archaeon]